MSRKINRLEHTNILYKYTDTNPHIYFLFLNAKVSILLNPEKTIGKITLPISLIAIATLVATSIIRVIKNVMKTIKKTS